MTKLLRTIFAWRQGAWGETCAAAHLKRNGMKIIGRNVRPSLMDRRYEIDLICKSGDGSQIVFVEVKTHRTRSMFAPRLWKIDKRKKAAMHYACSSWLERARWRGNYRFDVIEVYGDCLSDDDPEIDHIKNVPLFGRNRVG